MVFMKGQRKGNHCCLKKIFFFAQNHKISGKKILLTAETQVGGKGALHINTKTLVLHSLQTDGRMSELHCSFHWPRTAQDVI